MTTFELKNLIEFKANDQIAILTEFAFVVEKEISRDQIVDDFIRSNHFSLEFLRGHIKNESKNDYLRRALDFEKIKISDFRKYNKEETSKFLVDTMNEPDWGEDRNDFAKLLEKYFEIHNQMGNNDFLILSKDWFEMGDERVIEPEGWICIYYFLIFSIDRSSNVLTLAEWYYD